MKLSLQMQAKNQNALITDEHAKSTSTAANTSYLMAPKPTSWACTDRTVPAKQR